VARAPDPFPTLPGAPYASHAATVRRVGAVIAEGLLAGVGLGLAGVGVSLVWWVNGQFNLAQAAVVLIGAYAGWVAAPVSGPFGAAVVSVLAGGLAGLVVEVVLLRPVASQQAPVGLVITFAAGLALVAVLQVLFSSDYRAVVVGAAGLSVDGLALAGPALAGCAAAVVAVAATAAVRERTRLGAMVRSVAEDAGAARLAGVPVTAIRTGVGLLSGGMAGLAGWVVGSTGAFSTIDADRLLLLVSVPGLVAGAGRLAGALVVSAVLGGAGAAIAQFGPERLVDVVALVMLLVALVRLPGRREAATPRLRGRPGP